MSDDESKPSKPVATDEERGWEDWDEDQRRALGKSHQRTMMSLEDKRRGSFTSNSSKVDIMAKPSLRDPKDQILPSDTELTKQEQLAKERKRMEDSPLSKPHGRFFTRTCVMVASIALVCFSGIIAATFLLPVNGPGGTASFVHAGDNPPVPNDDTKRSTQGETVSDLAKSVTGYIRNAAFYIGNEVKPQHSKQTQFLFPDYSFNADEEDDKTGWKAPEYDGLYSKVEEPLIDVQPVLWITQRSGSKTLKDILTYCGRLVLASDSAEGHQESNLLEIFSSPDNAGHFANVNTETAEGLVRAKDLGLVDSELAHVLSTPLLAEGSTLFVDRYRTGRIFGLLREPVDQAVSDFRTRKTLPIDHPDRLPEELTLPQFIESDRLVTNPLTKALANVTDNTTITETHIYAAKKMLHERVVVGLLGAFEESVQRFFNYYGWTMHDPLCAANFRVSRDHRDDHDQLQETASEWKSLADRNWADKEVFEFAKTIIFPNQKGITKASS